MLANLSILQLIILLVSSISIFIFLLYLLIEASKKKKPIIPTYGRERIPATKGVKETKESKETKEIEKEIKDDDGSVLVAVISEKIGQLTRKFEDYAEVVRQVETTNSEQLKNLSKLNEMIERLEPIFSQLETNKANAGGKEAIMELAEKINLLEEKISKPAVEKTEIDEVKDRLNEVVTILKTLGS